MKRETRREGEIGKQSAWSATSVYKPGRYVSNHSKGERTKQTYALRIDWFGTETQTPLSFWFGLGHTRLISLYSTPHSFSSPIDKPRMMYLTIRMNPHQSTLSCMTISQGHLHWSTPSLIASSVFEKPQICNLDMISRQSQSLGPQDWTRKSYASVASHCLLWVKFLWWEHCVKLSRCYVDQQYGPTLSFWNRRRLTWLLRS